MKHTIIALLLIVAYSASGEEASMGSGGLADAGQTAQITRVEQFSFCLGRQGNRCDSPLVEKTQRVFEVDYDNLQREGESSVVWAWAKVNTDETMDMMFVFSHHGGNRWAETIHVGWLGRGVELLNQLRSLMMETLHRIYNNNSDSQYVQGLGFSVTSGSRNRYPMRFKVEHASSEVESYWVEIRTIGAGGHIIPGGERIHLNVLFEASAADD